MSPMTGMRKGGKGDEGKIRTSITREHVKVKGGLLTGMLTVTKVQGVDDVVN